MRVEVEFFHAEGSWYFSSFIHVLNVKELLLCVVLQDVARSWILEVTTFICCLSCFVNGITLTIFKHNDVATIVAIELSQYVVDIERSTVSIRWILHWVMLIEIFEVLLAHDNLSLQVIFVFKLLLTNHVLNQVSFIFKSLALSILAGLLVFRSLSAPLFFELFTLFPQLFHLLKLFSFLKKPCPLKFILLGKELILSDLLRLREVGSL